MAAIFFTPGLASLGPEQRADALALDACLNQIEAAITSGGIPFGSANLIRSAGLLWHDHLDESHAVSQDISDSDGSFLHGIMHRREPDYSNAKYWFNRVGSHDVFPDILNRAKAILTGTSLAHLIKSEWDSFAMVDAVSRAKVDSKEYALLQQVQAIEVESILRPLIPD
jgi:hypothetical protein